MPDERAARLAENETRFRTINDRVERDLEMVVDDPDELLPFICECAQRTCNARIELSRAEYERVREQPVLFAVAPGHEILDVEDVVERRERYVVIRKQPETWEIVTKTDPGAETGRRSDAPDRAHGFS
jgi:hypothetical protein